MIVLDFNCGFKSFYKRPMVLFQSLLCLSVPRFKVPVLPASTVIRDSRLTVQKTNHEFILLNYVNCDTDCSSVQVAFWLLKKRISCKN